MSMNTQREQVKIKITIAFLTSKQDLGRTLEFYKNEALVSMLNKKFSALPAYQNFPRNFVENTDAQFSPPEMLI